MANGNTAATTTGGGLGGAEPASLPRVEPVPGTKILLRRSSTAGKKPTADAAEYGELFINYHSTSPMLCFKDNADQIVEIRPLTEVELALGELTDVDTSGATTGMVLSYNGSTWVPVSAASIAIDVDLGYTAAADKGTVTNTAGDDATIPLATGTNAGLSLNDYTTTEKDKLAGIADGANVNVNADWNASSGDAEILNKPDIPDELSDLSDVDTSGATSGQLLRYDGSEWKPGSPAAVNVDLGYTPAADKGTVTNDSGSDATLLLADGSNAGLMAPGDYTKLSGIQAGAEVNVDPTISYNVLNDGKDGTLVVSPGGDTAIIDNATVSKAGLMTKGDKSKLDGYPATPGEISGTQDLQSVTDNGNTTTNIIETSGGVKVTNGNVYFANATSTPQVTFSSTRNSEAVRVSGLKPTDKNADDESIGLNLVNEFSEIEADSKYLGLNNIVVGGSTDTTAGIYLYNARASVGSTPTAAAEVVGYHCDNLHNDNANGSIIGFKASSTINSDSSNAGDRYGFVSDLSNAGDGLNKYNFYAAAAAPNFFAGDTYIGGDTTRNTRELWESLLTEEQKEQLAAGTLAIPANVSTPGDGSFVRQWWYDQQSAEDQALIDSGELEYPEHLQAANFTDTFVLGTNTAINLMSNGSIRAKGAIRSNVLVRADTSSTRGFAQLKQADGSTLSGALELYRDDTNNSTVTAIDVSTTEGSLFSVNYDGSASFGSGNITLKADGSGDFTKSVTAGLGFKGPDGGYSIYGSSLTSGARLSLYPTLNQIQVAFDNVSRFRFQNDALQVGTDISTPNITLSTDGRVTAEKALSNQAWVDITAGTWDAQAGNCFAVKTGTSTLAAPTMNVASESCSGLLYFEVAVSAFSGNFVFPGGVTPSYAANSVVPYTIKKNASDALRCYMGKPTEVA